MVLGKSNSHLLVEKGRRIAKHPVQWARIKFDSSVVEGEILPHAGSTDNKLRCLPQKKSGSADESARTSGGDASELSSIGAGSSGDVEPQSANLVQNHMFPIRSDAKTCTRCLSLFDSYLSDNSSGEKDIWNVQREKLRQKEKKLRTR